MLFQQIIKLTFCSSLCLPAWVFCFFVSSQCNTTNRPNGHGWKHNLFDGCKNYKPSSFRQITLTPAPSITPPRWNDFTDVTLSRLCCRVYGMKAEVYDFDMMKTPAKITKTCFWSNRSAFRSKLHKRNGSFYLKKNEWITLRSLDLVLMLADRSDLHPTDVRHVMNLYPAFSRFLDARAPKKRHDKTWY